MRRLVVLGVLGALALAAGAQATHTPQPRAGLWKQSGQPDLLTLRFAGGAYELRWANDTRVSITTTTTCTLPKGTLALKLREPTDGAWEVTEMNFAGGGSCSQTPEVTTARGVLIYPDGKFLAICQTADTSSCQVRRSYTWVNDLPSDSGGTSGGSGGAKSDAKAPVVKALAGKAKVGKVAKLRYTAYDDSKGQVDTSISLYKGFQLLSTTGFTGLRNAIKGTVYSATWTPPAVWAGALRFCVQGKDRAGNTSKPSCAALVVSK